MPDARLLTPSQQIVEAERAEKVRKYQLDPATNPDDATLNFESNHTNRLVLPPRSRSIRSIDSHTSVISNLSTLQQHTHSHASRIVRTRDRKTYLVTTSATDVYADEDEIAQKTGQKADINYLISQITKLNRGDEDNTTNRQSLFVDGDDKASNSNQSSKHSSSEDQSSGDQIPGNQTHLTSNNGEQV